MLLLLYLGTGIPYNKQYQFLSPQLFNVPCDATFQFAEKYIGWKGKPKRAGKKESYNIAQGEQLMLN